MTLTSALISQNLTDIRSGIYQAMQVVLRVPKTVVVQFQPSVAPSTDVFAQITVGTVASGDMANIKEGQLVIFSSTSDYQATDSFHTRVRKVNGTTILYVGENSQTLTTSHYVTVLDAYEIQEKLRKSTALVDWDITFRKLRPVETALQSAYVFFNDVVTFNETASPIVMDDDASSISTHAWESSNSNDTLDSGGSTATPTFTLEANSFRWLRYTFTDDLGLSNFRAIPVWTIGKDYNNPYIIPVDDGSGLTADISFDAELGRTCSFTAYADADELLNRNMICVASDEWYGGRTNSDRQSIRTNINFIGYLQSESANQQADETHGRVSDVAFVAEGFGHQLARQNISEVTIIQTNASATAWDAIQDPTPGRILTYRLTEYSTASSLMAVGIPSDDSDFVGDDLTLDSGKLLDDLRFIADGYNAEIQFDVTGKLDMCRDLNFLGTTDRNAAPVVATLTPADYTDGYTIEFEHGFSTSEVNITAGSYQTSSDSYSLFEGIAPAEARYSEGDSLVLSNQVLETDNTAQENITELAQRAANFLAFNNPTWILRANMPDWWLAVLCPDVGSWWQHNIASTDTARGKVFDSSNRWQLVQVNYQSNSRLGIRRGDCIWRHETESTGASVRAAPIVNDFESDINYLPAIAPPFSGADLGDTGGDWYDSQDPQPPSEPTPPGQDCELGGFRPKTLSSYETSTPALNGELVEITVRGRGQVQQGTDYDFTASNQSFTAVAQSGSGDPQGTYTSSVGWEDTDTEDQFNNWHRGVAIERSGLSLGTVTKVVVTFDYEKGDPLGFSGSATAGFISLNGSTVASRTFDNFSDGSDLTWEWTGSVTSVTSLSVRIDSDGDSTSDANLQGSVTIKSIQINDNTIYGDSFYEWTGSLESPENVAAYGSGDGLLIEGSQPASIPPFSPTSEYTLYDTVTSGPILYEYGEPYGTVNMGNWSIQIITCFKGVP